MNTRKILSIIPATGVFSSYHNDSNAETLDTFPLICWAMVEYEDGTVKVEGMDISHDGVPEICSADAEFAGYMTSQEIEASRLTD